MEVKTCKDCKEEKTLKEFYGVQGECKDCTRSRVRAREEKLSLNPDWVEKEKTRHRLKYHRLEYREAHKPTPEMKKGQMERYNDKYPEKRLAKNMSQRIKPNIKGNTMHHWSYSLEFAKDVIELSFKAHKKAHRFLIYDQERMMYRRYDTNELLDTKEAHEAFIIDCIKNKPD